MHRYTEELARHGLVTGQVLLTLDDVTRRAHYRNAYQTFAKLLELGVLPIVNENDTVATTEIRFGDNDRLAALVAHLVHADLLVLLTDVDGLYDADPSARALAPHRRDLRGRPRPGPDRPGAGRGRDRRHADQGRGRPDRHRGRHPRRPHRRRPGPGRAGRGARSAPSSTPPAERRPTRLLWLAHATEPKGPWSSTPGRCVPWCERRASLLAAGLTGATGEFVAGDPVDLGDPDGVAVAAGLVNFDADEVPTLLGRSSHDLKRDLGAAYEREVVHRDDLVLLWDARLVATLQARPRGGVRERVRSCAGGLVLAVRPARGYRARRSPSGTRPRRGPRNAVHPRVRRLARSPSVGGEDSWPASRRVVDVGVVDRGLHR